MDLFNRVWLRIGNEGITRTLQYFTYVLFDTIRSFICELFMDLKFSGKFLCGNHKTTYSHMGAHDVYHTDYSIMPLIFEHVNITPEDILVDVGCGKGRVINFWLSKGYQNKIIGLELDPAIAAQTAAQFAKWPNVEILSGDAIYNLPYDGTIFYFYNSFSELKVLQFQKRMLDLFSHKPVTIVYYRPKSLYLFKNGHWKINLINFEKDHGLKRWGRLNKYHELAIITRDLSPLKDPKILHKNIARKAKLQPIK